MDEKVSMSHSQNTQYLESKVLTAPPHRLHLMLLEGAIRFGRQAEAAMSRGDSLAASIPLTRVIDILGELLAGVRERKTELNRKIADFYTFLFRSVAEAKVNDSAAKLGEVLKLLEFERQTWQLVCDKMEAADSAKPRAPIAPPLGNALSSATSIGLSLEA
jgi:flagellar protein FliS